MQKAQINHNVEDVDLERLKRETPILSLAGSFGIEFKKVGKNEYAGLCPFHEDKNPSLHINVLKNLFHCKGCGKSGSVIDWLILTENLTLPEAIGRLRSDAAMIVRAFERAAKIEEDKPVDILEPFYQNALGLALAYWHDNFKNKKEGADYLLKRGLIYGELVEEFKIGYSDGSLIDVANDDDIINALIDLGAITMLDDGKLVETFQNRVLIPVFNEDKNIIQVYGRNLKNTGPKHLYLKAPLAGLFHQRALLSSDLILAESFIDALSIMAMGYPNVCSSFGVNGLKESAIALFETNGVKRVYVAYDSDPAGDDAAEVLSEKFIAKKIETYRINFDEGQDANEFLRKATSIDEAKKMFKDLVERARPLKLLTDTEGVYVTGRVEKLERKGKEYFYKSGHREYTIRGLDQNKTNSSLKIFLRLEHETKFHIDNNVDLFSAKATGSFVKAAATRLTIDERVVRADLDALIVKLDEIHQKAIEEKDNQKKVEKKEYHKNLAVSQKAKEFLYDPLFIVRFVKDIERCGLVGEPLNMFFGFLSTLTRYFQSQIHIIIQSESSAGKSTMLNLLSEFVPEEESIYFTQVTPRSLYYGEPGFLKNKCIFIAESDGLREAEFPIKQMMSEGKLSISYTKTDPQSGEHTSDIKENEGPVQFTLTEPTEGLHEEIENRSVILTLDMSTNQTSRILELQRLMHSPEGVILKNRKRELSDFYRHVQREVKPYEVLNYYSPHLNYNAEHHQARRDNQKYLSILSAVTMLFQYQREKTMKDSKLCLKTHLIDIAITHFLIRRVFAKSLDELPIQTRNFVEKLVKHFIKYSQKMQVDFDQIWFYRKDMREVTGLSNTRVHEHTSRLVDFEYLTTKRDQNGICYRFLFEPNIEEGFYTSLLKLSEMKSLVKKASKKERREYEDFIPSLKIIFKTLDPDYKTGEF